MSNKSEEKKRSFGRTGENGKAFLCQRFRKLHKLRGRRENWRALISKTASASPEATFASLRVAARIVREARVPLVRVPLHISGKSLPNNCSFPARLPWFYPQGLEIIERPLLQLVTRGSKDFGGQVSPFPTARLSGAANEI